MKNVVSIGRKDNTQNLLLIWCLHNTCNFQCDYCPEFNYNASEKWLTKEIAYQLVDSISNHYRETLAFDNITIAFTGGEPTLCSFFKELCHYIRSKNIMIGLSTNGSSAPAYWKGFASLFEWISLSFHPRSVKRDQFLESMMEIYNDKEAPIPSVCLMMPPDIVMWTRCIDFAAKIKHTLPEWNIDYVKIRNDFGQKTHFSYNDEQCHFFTQHGTESRSVDDSKRHEKSFDFAAWYLFYENGYDEFLLPNNLINTGFNKFKGWYCNIGIEMLEVDYFGKIKKAGSCIHGKQIGTVRDLSSLELPLVGVTCNQDECTCASNFYVSKNRQD